MGNGEPEEKALQSDHSCDFLPTSYAESLLRGWDGQEFGNLAVSFKEHKLLALLIPRYFARLEHYYIIMHAILDELTQADNRCAAPSED